MHLRLGQKEKLWTGEYVEDEEEDGPDEAIGEDEEVDNLYEDDVEEFEGKGWENHGEEEDGDEVEESEEQEKEEWEVSDFPSQSTPYSRLQQPYHHGQHPRVQQLGEPPVENVVSQAEVSGLFGSQFSRYRALKRLRRLRRIRSHRVLSFQLAKHWKSWRQKARWITSTGQQWGRRGQRYHLYGRQRRTKRFLPHYDDEDDSQEEQLPGTNAQIIRFHLSLMKTA